MVNPLLATSTISSDACKPSTTPDDLIVLPVLESSTTVYSVLDTHTTPGVPGASANLDVSNVLLSAMGAPRATEQEFIRWYE